MVLHTMLYYPVPQTNPPTLVHLALSYAGNSVIAIPATMSNNRRSNTFNVGHSLCPARTIPCACTSFSGHSNGRSFLGMEKGFNLNGSNGALEQVCVHQACPR